MLLRIVKQGAERPTDFKVHDDPASLVAARLRRSGYPYLCSIKCDVRDGVVVLSGTLPTYHLKQLAQSLALHTPGVREIENRVHVTNLAGAPAVVG